MGVSDKVLGGSMLCAAACVFVYYSTWALLLPFFEDSHQIHSYFPDREWAIRLPAFILVVGMSSIGAFIGNTIMKEKAKKARARIA